MNREHPTHRTAVPATIAILLAVLFLASCVTFDQESTGGLGETLESEGVTMTYSIPDQARVLLTATNDTSEEITITVRPENVLIGWRGSNGRGSGPARAAWIMTPSILLLGPGDTGSMNMSLNNWYLVMKDFGAEIPATIAQGEARRLVSTTVDQDDLFRDPETLYRENKTNKNRPENSTGVTIGISGTFTLTSSF